MAIEIARSYTDLLFLFIWYSVEFVFMICVILFTSREFNFPKRFWASAVENAPPPQVSPLATASGFLGDAAHIAKQLRNAFNDGAAQPVIPVATAVPPTPAK